MDPDMAEAMDFVAHENAEWAEWAFITEAKGQKPQWDKRRSRLEVPREDERQCASLPIYPGYVPNDFIGVLVEAKRIHLLDEIDRDIARLDVVKTREAYLASWDALHPELPAILNPDVWRIVWRFERVSDAPEWSQAA